MIKWSEKLKQYRLMQLPEWWISQKREEFYERVKQQTTPEEVSDDRK